VAFREFYPLKPAASLDIVSKAVFKARRPNTDLQLAALKGAGCKKTSLMKAEAVQSLAACPATLP
jgi:hypothetical protein